MHNPPHPGDILREDVLPDLGLSVTDAAEQLGVSRVTLSRVINGQAGISAEMAIRLGRWLGNGADVWVRMQGAYDLWQAQKQASAKVKSIKPAVRRAEKTEEHAHANGEKHSR
jgi:addiction module HigA family antidote